MPIFEYKAKKGPTEVLSGSIDALSKDDAVSKIIARGLVPLEVESYDQAKDQIRPEQLKKANFSLFNKIRVKDVLEFTRELSDLINASVPMLQALKIIDRQIKNIKFKLVVQDVIDKVRDGASLSDAMKKHSSAFGNFYINIIAVGQLSGQLGQCLASLADHMEKEDQIKSKIKAAMAYPLLVLFVGFVTIFVLFCFVVPQLSVLFEDMNQQLPFFTTVVLFLSKFMSRFWWLISAFLAIVFVGFKGWLNTNAGRLSFDNFKLKIPYLGDFLRFSEISRFTRSLGLMLASGVNISRALAAVSDSVDNSNLKLSLNRVMDEVNNGKSISESLRQIDFFTEFTISMITVGEQTGSLASSLFKVSDRLDKNTEEMSKAFISVLGPAILILIVSVIGVVLISILLPIMQMNVIF